MKKKINLLGGESVMGCANDVWFAWRPVRLGALGTGRMVWLKRVWRSRCARVAIYQPNVKKRNPRAAAGSVPVRVEESVDWFDLLMTGLKAEKQAVKALHKAGKITTQQGNRHLDGLNGAQTVALRVKARVKSNTPTQPPNVLVETTNKVDVMKDFYYSKKGEQNEKS